jgi:hypothetical protein
VKQIHLTTQLTDDEADKFGGHFVTDKDYDLLVTEDADVYTPEGEPLLKFRTNALSRKACAAAYPNLKDAPAPSSNRGIAGGMVDPERIGEDAEHVAHASKTRYARLKRDGTKSKTTHANPVDSGIIGYFDRNPRFPYCRQTAFNMNNAEQFAQAMPYFQEVNAVFREEMPDRWEAQRQVVESTTPEFVISGTVFTTITVNRNWRTAVHKDAGDLKTGFGVMNCFRAGQYAGGYLCFPKYRAAVNMTTRCVLLADVHQWHGNTELLGRDGHYERLSCIFYYREGMKYCGTPEAELERARRRQPGDGVKREQL